MAREPSVVTNTFNETGAPHSARIVHTATLLADGRVLIAGGMINSRYATFQASVIPGIQSNDGAPVGSTGGGGGGGGGGYNPPGGCYGNGCGGGGGCSAEVGGRETNCMIGAAPPIFD